MIEAFIAALSSLFSSVGRAISSSISAIFHSLSRLVSAILSGLWNILSIIGSIVYQCCLSVYHWLHLLFVVVMWRRVLVGWLYARVIRDLVWRRFLYGFVWVYIVYPTGLVGLRILSLISRGVWFGYFVDGRLVFLDGFFQESLPRYPDTFTPPVWLYQVFGLVFGLGLGLRGYLDLLFVVVKAAWFGFPSLRLRLDESLLISTAETAVEWKSKFLTPALSLVFGLGIGWRSVFAVVFAVPRCAWIGSLGLSHFPGFSVFSHSFHMPQSSEAVPELGGYSPPSLPISADDPTSPLPPADALDSPSISPPPYPLSPPETRSRVGLVLGWIFGLGLGLRFIICLLIYVVVTLPFAHVLPLLLWGAWIGLVDVPIFLSIHWSYDLVKYQRLHNPLKRLLFSLGSLVFGAIVGLRTLIIGVVLLPYFVYCVLVLLMRSMWFGVAPVAFHFADSPLDVPPVSKCVYLGRFQRLLGRCIFAPLFGVVIGWRSVVAFLVFIIYGAFVGPFRVKEMPHGLFPEDSINIVPKSRVGKALAFIFGLGMGFRYYINLIWTFGYRLVSDSKLLLIEGGRISASVAYGAWVGLHYGIFVDEGFFTPFTDEELAVMNRWRRSQNVGALLFGLGLGWRQIFNFVLVCGKALYYGYDPVYLINADGVFGVSHTASAIHPDSVAIEPIDTPPTTPAPVVVSEVYKTPRVSKVLALIFGGLGLKVLLNWISLLPIAFWYGFAPMTFHVEDSLLEPPKIKYQNGYTRWVSVPFGLAGIRSVISFVLLLPVLIWNGFDPILFHPGDSPLDLPQFKYKSSLSHFLAIPCGIIGLRTVVSLILTIPKAMYYGCAPTFIVLDGHIPNDGHFKNPWMGLLGIFGLGFGLRFIFNVVSMIPSGIVYGFSYELTMRSALIAGSEPFSESELYFKPNKDVSRILGVLGCGIGLLTLIYMILTLLQGSVWILRGVFYGHLRMENDDGFISSLKDFDFKKPVNWFSRRDITDNSPTPYLDLLRQFIYCIGSACCLFIGVFNILNILYIVVKAAFIGLLLDYFVMPIDLPRMKTPLGKMCTIFGLGIGIAGILGIIQLTVRILLYGVDSLKHASKKQVVTLRVLYFALFTGVGFVLPALLFLPFALVFQIVFIVAMLPISALITHRGLLVVFDVKYLAKLFGNSLLIIIGSAIYLPLWPLFVFGLKLVTIRYLFACGVGDVLIRRKRTKAIVRFFTFIVVTVAISFALVTFGPIMALAIYAGIIASVMSTIAMRFTFPSRSTLEYSSAEGVDPQLIQSVGTQLYSSIRAFKLGREPDIFKSSSSARNVRLKRCDDELWIVRMWIRDLRSRASEEHSTRTMHNCLLEGRCTFTASSEAPAYQERDEPDASSVYIEEFGNNVRYVMASDKWYRLELVNVELGFILSIRPEQRNVCIEKKG